MELRIFYVLFLSELNQLLVAIKRLMQVTCEE